MTQVPYLDAAELRRLVPMRAAIDAVERLFAEGGVEVPQRAHLDVGGGDLLVMPAWGGGGVGVKLVTVNPSNPSAGRALVNGVYVLFARESLEPVLMIDGAAVTALRTPAVSAVATRHLAAPDAATLVLFGAGTQTRGHLEAMRAVRHVSSVVVIARSPASAEAFVDEARAARLDARSGVPEDVRAADIVCTCTTSPTPVFDGALLRSGAHVNAVGAYKPNARELDDVTIRRATVVVEDRAAATAEAGDVVQPLRSGVLDDVLELGEVLRTGRPAGDVTVFKSVGLASEDLAVAAAALEALG
ncbi:MAG TPA: ornithine cyclodeaminase family protein [Actinomycetota bacterium]|nr:ornithine cyclodeaminase family protein [Actinomycetota bacterium]